MVTTWRRIRHIMRWAMAGLAVAGGAAVVISLSVGPGRAASRPAASGRADTVALAASASAASGSQIATHYVLQAVGNCSYPGPPANQLFVALPAREYAGAARCGSYLMVKGPHGSVRVEVIDQCPECKAGHIDLSERAFAKLAPLKAGIIPVSYRTIVNPPLPAPVAFEVKNGSSRYWLALFVMNTGNAIASVQLQTAPGRWLKLTHANWNGWIAQQGAGPGPFTIRVTDTRGHRVTVHNVALKPNKVQRTKTWMYK